MWSTKMPSAVKTNSTLLVELLSFIFVSITILKLFGSSNKIWRLPKRKEKLKFTFWFVLYLIIVPNHRQALRNDWQRIIVISLYSAVPPGMHLYYVSYLCCSPCLFSLLLWQHSHHRRALQLEMVVFIDNILDPLSTLSGSAPQLFGLLFSVPYNYTAPLFSTTQSFQAWCVKLQHIWTQFSFNRLCWRTLDCRCVSLQH